MKQKIVINVQMRCEKCRVKAMSVVASVHGIGSVALDGDHLVMEGDDVDPVKLTKKLRKKVGNADIVKVEEVKKDDKKINESKGESSDPKMEYPLQWYPQYNPVVVYDLGTNSNPNICSIM